MQAITLSETLQIEDLTLKKHPLELAQTMFEYVNADRERLQKFLPWVPYIQTPADEYKYIQMTHNNWEKQTGFDYGIYWKNTYVGNLGVHNINWHHSSCELGYWILGEHEGQGLITRAVAILETHLFEKGFNRIQIRCSDLNQRSEGVPIRLGYTYEGLAREDCFEMGAFRNTKTFSKLKKDL